MKRLLFRLARLPISSRPIGWVFTHMSFAIPVKRLRETKTLIAFHHLQQSHSFHALLVAKRSFSSLLDIPHDATDFMRDLITTAQNLVREHHLESCGYRLIANGGAYQDIPHLHFHLIADTAHRAER